MKLDPSDHAAAVDPGDEDGVGVRHDELMDAAIAASDASRQLADAHVDLDGLLDDLGLFPDEMHSDLRRAQEDIRRWAEWSDEFADALRERQAEARADA